MQECIGYQRGRSHPAPPPAKIKSRLLLEPPERTRGAHALLDQLAADRLLGFDKRIDRDFLGPLGCFGLEIQSVCPMYPGMVDTPPRNLLGAVRCEAGLGH